MLRELILAGVYLIALLQASTLSLHLSSDSRGADGGGSDGAADSGGGEMAYRHSLPLEEVAAELADGENRLQLNPILDSMMFGRVVPPGRVQSPQHRAYVFGKPAGNMPHRHRYNDDYSADENDEPVHQRDPLNDLFEERMGHSAHGSDEAGYRHIMAQQKRAKQQMQRQRKRNQKLADEPPAQSNNDTPTAYGVNEQNSMAAKYQQHVSNNKRSGSSGNPPQMLQPMQHSMARELMMRSARGQRQYDVPIIECPPAMDGMDRFACPTPDRQGRYRCIDGHLMCDGFIDCPEGEEEDRLMCMFYKANKSNLDVYAEALLRFARAR